MRDPSCPPRALAACALALVATTARADWRDPIAGAMPIRAATFQPGDGTLTVHALPRREPDGADPAGDAPAVRWSLPLVDRRLDAAVRAAPLAPGLLEAIGRIEPIYDPTLLDGPVDHVPMRVSAGTAEMRDVFADHWRVASADVNVDGDTLPLAAAWSATTAPRPCSSFHIRRRHAWHEPALTAPTSTDCRAIALWQARGYAEATPLPVAIAAPPLPVFAAPEPGSRMSSADFWAARRAQIAGIHEHFQRKWTRGHDRLRTSRN